VIDQPPPEAMQQILGALVGNDEQISRFLGLMAGSVSVSDFFSPSSVADIMRGAPVPA
jgi:hypothetical protein